MKQKHQIYLVGFIAIAALGVALWSAYNLQKKGMGMTYTKATTTDTSTTTNTGSQDGGQGTATNTTTVQGISNYGGEMPIDVNAIIN